MASSANSFFCCSHHAQAMEELVTSMVRMEDAMGRLLPPPARRALRSRLRARRRSYRAGHQGGSHAGALRLGPRTTALTPTALVIPTGHGMAPVNRRPWATHDVFGTPAMGYAPMEPRTPTASPPSSPTPAAPLLGDDTRHAEPVTNRYTFGVAVGSTRLGAGATPASFTDAALQGTRVGPLGETHPSFIVGTMAARSGAPPYFHDGGWLPNGSGGGRIPSDGNGDDLYIGSTTGLLHRSGALAPIGSNGARLPNGDGARIPNGGGGVRLPSGGDDLPIGSGGGSLINGGGTRVPNGGGVRLSNGGAGEILSNGHGGGGWLSSDEEDHMLE
ncbi:hypothetical protein ACP4OV_000051 [Aristida adscensionis]